MPNCFMLRSKIDNEPAILQKIDDELWLLFTGAIPEPNDQWYCNWYNTIGLLLACGQSWDQMRNAGFSDELTKVIDHLSKNYTPSSWYQHK